MYALVVRYLKSILHANMSCQIYFSSRKETKNDVVQVKFL